MKVLLAPDWRDGNPYQQLLAGHLADAGLEVEFLSEYRRCLPLARAVPHCGADVLHLHWPDAYFANRGDGIARLREWRFPFDLALACRAVPMVATAHNLYPHDRSGSPAVRRAMRAYYRRAIRVIVHSQAAISTLTEEFGVDPARCRFVPHGDLAVGQPDLPNPAEARSRLGVGARNICLMFGVIQPYKGIEEMIALWAKHRFPAELVIAGKPESPDYVRRLATLSEDVEGVRLLAKWMEEGTLRDWLAAADAVVFNYRAILVSGAAVLARSYGIPILVPARLDTIDLMEPHPSVFRFGAGDFPERLAAALRCGRTPEAAHAWREEHAWATVAARTGEVYREAIASRTQQFSF